MICSKCGTNNNDSAKFCIICGNPISTLNVQTPAVPSFSQNDISTNAPSFRPNDQGSQPINSSLSNSNLTNPVVNNQTLQPVNQVTSQNLVSNGVKKPFNFFKFIWSFILKPVETFEKEEENLNDTKTALIISAIVATGMMIFNLINSMVTSVIVKTIDFSGDTTVSWVWSNLKNLNYLNLIGKNLLICATILFLVSGLYFLASRVVKQSVKYVKFLSITCVSIVPFMILNLLVSSLIMFIYEPLGLIIMIIGCIYSLLILIELVNKQIALKNVDLKIYFNLICLSIIGSSIAFTIYWILKDTVSNLNY
ncbi:MAG: YIP1 family protein [Bacilli bacterium]